MALSAPLITRKRMIQSLIETEKGTKVAGTNAAAAIDLVIDSTGVFLDRKSASIYMGHEQPGVIGLESGECSFKAEMRSTGSAALDAGLAELLQCCGFKQAAEVYTICSAHADQKCVSLDVYEDGVKKGLAGASGNVVIEGETGEQMFCNFHLEGVWQAPVDAALAGTPGTTLPMIIKGGTFTLATESIKITRFSLDMAAQLVNRLDADAAAGFIYTMISDFDGPILTMTVEADKIAGYDFFGAWLAGTTGAVSLVIDDGTDKATIAIPKYQYRSIKEGDTGGIQTYELVGQCNHDSGDDAVSIAVAAII